ncbi:MAG: hypothetical protein PHN80_14540 [Hespellia sp.]|nr:hypothetical protein [Hespellia sp.]
MRDFKNPWSVYSPALVSMGVLYIFAFVLKLNVMQIIIGAIAIGLILFGNIFLWCVVYPEWFARKTKLCMDNYQQTYDSDTYSKEIAHLEKFAFSKACKNILVVSKWGILYKENRLQECLELLSEYEPKAKSKEEKLFVLNKKILCYQKMNDTYKTTELERELQSFNDKHGGGAGNEDKPLLATAYESKQAMFRWLMATLVSFLLIIVVVCLELYDGLIVLFLFIGVMNFLVSLAWIIRWLILRAKESKHQ